MTYGKVVALVLGKVGKSAKPVARADGRQIFSARQQLVRVALMTYVPNDFVLFAENKM